MRLEVLGKGLAQGLFQSTHPRGVRQWRLSAEEKEIVFQSTHPRGVRRVTHFSPRVHITYFNPRTREGCDKRRTRLYHRRGCISIHAPARGATLSPADVQVGEDGFQSTHPRGVRPFIKSCKQTKLAISIHAPARGATQKGCREWRNITYFNPRTREGCDRPGQGPHRLQWHFNPRTREGCDNGLSFQWLPRRDFNPRTREGCDPLKHRSPLPRFYFNPRTREGCDHLLCYLSYSRRKFQSTHPRGVRRTFYLPCRRIGKISIHAPARGATIDSLFCNPISPNFNPRTREGCDSKTHDIYREAYGFQSTHPRGVRRGACRTSARRIPISIHAPARGATRRAYQPEGRSTDFNPRTREGCDLLTHPAASGYGLFQSTHPRGVRQSTVKKSPTVL